MDALRVDCIRVCDTHGPLNTASGIWLLHGFFGTTKNIENVSVTNNSRPGNNETQNGFATKGSVPNYLTIRTVICTNFLEMFRFYCWYTIYIYVNKNKIHFKIIADENMSVY